MRLFDLHCDTIYACLKDKQDLLQNNLQVSLANGKNIENWVQTFAFWISDDLRGESAYLNFKEQYRLFIAMLRKYPNKLSLYKNQGDIKPGVCFGLLAIEGGSVLGGDLSKIEDIRNMGVQLLTLCWNGKNEIASGALSEGRFTTFGRQAVQELERCGVIVDASHLNRESFWDLCRIAKKPFVATHSNADTVRSHPRNLDDDQIREIIERDGLIGLNFYKRFLSSKKEPTEYDLFKHMDYILHLGGENVLSIGSDFDGAEMPLFINSIKKIENLYNSVLKYSGKEIAEKIFFKNAKNFFDRNLKCHNT